MKLTLSKFYVFCATVVVLQLSPPAPVAHAELDPLRSIRVAAKTLDVVFVVATNDTMQKDAAGANDLGVDCDNSAGLHHCGDGFCGGNEGTAANPCAAPAEDCMAGNPAPTSSPGAGSYIKCRDPVPAGGKSRLNIVKDALRQILPRLTNVANVGLVTYNQHVNTSTNLEYEYLEADTGGTRTVSMLIHRAELDSASSWTGQQRTAPNQEPPSTFTPDLTPFSLTGVQLTRNNEAPASYPGGAHVYRRPRAGGYEYRRTDTWEGDNWVDAGPPVRRWTYWGTYYYYTAFDIKTTPVTPNTQPRYHGPAFVGGGTTYVFRRIDYDLANYSMIANTDEATSQQALDPITTGLQLSTNWGSLLNRLNLASHGGVHATTGGQVPLGEAIQAAQAMLLAHKGVDAAAACRRSVVIVIPDAASTGAADPVAAAGTLVTTGALNGTSILKVVTPPGVASAPFDAIANAGDTSGPATATTTVDEQDLVRQLTEKLFEGTSIEYAIGAPGVGRSETSVLEGNVAIVAVSEYPAPEGGFRGHLRAYDLTNPLGPTQLWDAGEKLRQTNRDWRTRKIYTGLSTRNASRMVPLIGGAAGDPNDGSCGVCGGTTVNTIWSDLFSDPVPDDLGDFLQALAGSTTEWHMPGFINSTPVVVGAAPLVGDEAGTHDTWATSSILLTQREPIVYAVSNTMIHAVSLSESRGGEELFAFVPAHLLRDLYRRYHESGGFGPDHGIGGFQPLMTGHPRVNDMPQGGPSWRTELVVTDGHGGNFNDLGPPYNDANVGGNFVALNISYPSIPNCIGTPCTYFDLFSNTIRILVDSANPAKINAGGTPHTLMGKLISTPAMFWDLDGGTDPNGKFAMLSGYGNDNVGFLGLAISGLYYNYFPDLWNIKDSGTDFFTAADGNFWFNPVNLTTPTTPSLVPADRTKAYTADVVAVVDISNGHNILATYQADTRGVIWRYQEGRPASAPPTNPTPTMVMTADVTRPFQLAPGAIHVGQSPITSADETAIAANSGSFHDNDPYMSDPGFISKVFMISESAGVTEPARYTMSCDVDKVCTGTCFTNQVVGPCEAPSARALPLSSPLITTTADNPKSVNAFYYYIDPPAPGAECVGTEPAVGDAYLMRLFSAGANANNRITATVKGNNIIPTPVAVVGGGSMLVVGVSGNAPGVPANVAGTVAGTVINGPMPMGFGKVVSETWSEVR